MGAWKRPDAIHIKEGRASLLGLQRGCRRAECRGRVILSVGDNMSEILGCEKGRARDRELNALCRRATALRVAANVGWRRRHCIMQRGEPFG